MVCIIILVGKKVFYDGLIMIVRMEDFVNGDFIFKKLKVMIFKD